MTARRITIEMTGEYESAIISDSGGVYAPRPYRMKKKKKSPKLKKRRIIKK